MTVSKNGRGEKMKTKWTRYHQGKSIGTKGPEDGIIILDNEHSEGARITLENEVRNGSFAITCGIYGLMVHTAFFRKFDDAKKAFGLMKRGTSGILRLPPDDDFENVLEAVERFTNRW